MATEKRENVRFANGEIELEGTLISPTTGGKHAAIILVHGSGPEDRESMVPFARFLIRHGVAVLGYDTARRRGTLIVVLAFGFAKPRRSSTPLTLFHLPVSGPRFLKHSVIRPISESVQ